MAPERDSLAKERERAARERAIDMAMYAYDNDRPTPDGVERHQWGPPLPEPHPTGGDGVRLATMCQGCVAFVGEDPLARRRHKCTHAHKCIYQGAVRGTGCLWCAAHNRRCVAHPDEVKDLAMHFEAQMRHVVRKCENGAQDVDVHVGFAKKTATDIKLVLQALAGGADEGAGDEGPAAAGAAAPVAGDGSQRNPVDLSRGTEESPLVIA